MPYFIRLSQSACRAVELEDHIEWVGGQMCSFVDEHGRSLTFLVAEDELFDSWTGELVGKIYATTDSCAPQF